MAEVVNVKVLVVLTKDCDPATGESSLLSSSSLKLGKYLSYNLTYRNFRTFSRTADYP